MNKQPIKLSEARIIMHIDCNESTSIYIRLLSTNLNIDYGYLLRLIPAMVNKQWIKKVRKSGKTYIDLASKAPIEKSRELLANRK